MAQSILGRGAADPGSCSDLAEGPVAPAMLANLVGDDPEHGLLTAGKRCGHGGRHRTGGGQSPSALEGTAAIVSGRAWNAEYELARPSIGQPWNGARGPTSGRLCLLAHHDHPRCGEPRRWPPQSPTAGFDSLTEPPGFGLGELVCGKSGPYRTGELIEGGDGCLCDGGFKLVYEHVEPLGLGPRRASRSRPEK